MKRLTVQSKQCSTCIFKPESLFNIKQLLNDVRDPSMEGHFKTFRQCHHSEEACCRGFWDRFKDNFAVGQIAQRLGLVVFVEDEGDAMDCTK